MKELELELKLRNNLLKRRRLDLGLTALQFSEQVGVSHTTYVAYESLKYSPLSSKGGWKPSALRISDFYKTLPETLWPEAVLEIKNPVARVELAAEEALALAGYQYEQTLSLPETPEDAAVVSEKRALLDQALSKLTARQATVLRARARGATFGEIGEELEVGVERVRQIEMGALRRLRHPRFARKLRSFIDPDFEEKPRIDPDYEPEEVT